jgi:hypothetical protein
MVQVGVGSKLGRATGAKWANPSHERTSLSQRRPAWSEVGVLAKRASACRYSRRIAVSDAPGPARAAGTGTSRFR